MTKATIKEVLFGRLATRGKFVTEEQIAECLALQDRYRTQGGPVPRLGEILAVKGYMSAEQVRAVLDGQHGRREGLFGEIAIRWRFLDRPALEEALDLQRQMDAAGKPRSRLGEVLVEHGRLHPHQVRAMLEAQGKKIVHCSGCNARFNVAHFRPGARLTCSKCGAVTVMGEGDRHVSDDSPLDVTGTVWLPKEEPAEQAPGAERAALEIGGYEVLTRLGADAVGSICRARHLGTGQVVALKVMRPGPQLGAEFLERFVEDSRQAIELDHPNLKRVHEVGSDRGRYFLAEEFIEGCSLKRQLELVGRLAPSEATDIATQIAEALEYGHRRGIVHADLRPSNVIIDTSGRARLAGLGVAKDAVLNVRYFGRGATSVPFYLAPEQALEAARTDVRSDIYSLGAVLYHMITGRPPYVGQGSIEVLMRLTQEPLIPPEQIVAGLPGHLSRLIVRMLAAEPDERPQTIAEVLGKLRRSGRFLRVKGGPAARPAAAASAARVPTPSAPAQPAARERLAAESFGERRYGRERFHQRRGSSTLARVAVGVVLAAMGVGMFVWFWGARSGSRVVYTDTARPWKGRPEPEAPKPVPPDEELFMKARDFARENAGDDEAIAAAFKRVFESNPDGEFAGRARIKYREHLTLAARNALRKRVSALKEGRDELQAKGDFKGCLAQLEEWKKNYPEVEGEFGSEYEDARRKVLDAQQRHLDARLAEAEALAGEKKFAEARAFLNKFKGLVTAEGETLLADRASKFDETEKAEAEAQRQAQEEAARKKREEEELKRKEAEAKRLTALAGTARAKAARLVTARQFGEALKALGAVRDELTGSEHAAKFAQMEEAIRCLQSFHRALAKGISGRGRKPRLRFADKLCPVIRADERGLTLSLGSGVTTLRTWAKLEAAEAVKLGAAYHDRRDAAQVAGFAVFCHLAGDAAVAGRQLERAGRLGAKAEAIKAVLDGGMLTPPPEEKPEKKPGEEEKAGG